MDDITQMLELKFGKMKVARGSCHEFLGQFITHNDDGTFDLNMPSYLKDAVEEFGEPMEPAVTPPRSDLFTVDHTSLLVDEKRKKYSTVLCIHFCTAVVGGGNIFRWPFLS